MKKCFYTLFLAAWFFVCFCSATMGEDYVDLSQRFDDIVTYDYQDVTYYMKDRVSTTLVMCVNPSDGSDGDIGDVELMIMLVIDDDTRTVKPLQIDPATNPAWIEGETLTLEQLFSNEADVDSGCLVLMNTINAAFPQPVCEHYAVLDLNGLTVLDNIPNTPDNTTGAELVARLKAIKAAAEQAGADSVSYFLDSLSGYIITDMKSGAMMKIVDKVDRFDRTSRIYFPVIAADDSEDIVETLIPDAEAFEPLMIALYFEDERSW